MEKIGLLYVLDNNAVLGEQALKLNAVDFLRATFMLTGKPLAVGPAIKLFQLT
jgi:hypothetical protein